MTRNVNFFQIPLLVVLTVLIPGSAAQAQNNEAQERIDAIEARSDQAAERRQLVREELNKADRLARIVTGWFQKKGQVEAEIQRLETQKKTGAFNIYDTRQLDDQLQAMRKKLDDILRLEGGVVIDGDPFNSFYTLQEELKRKNSEAMRLNDEYVRLTQELRTLDQERDTLLPLAQEQAKKSVYFDQFKLGYLQEDLEMLQTLVSNNELWILQASIALGAVAPHMSRERAITLLTNEYILSVQSTPGKKGDHRELAEVIKQYQAQSEAIKRQVREHIIPEKMREIEELRQQIKMREGGENEILGCWVVMVGSGNYPVVEIGVNSQGDYEAIITNVGQLDFFKRGNRLFSVSRINADTYDGTEYSFTADGRPTRIPLRLVISRDGKSIHYRADSIVTLRRCD